MNNPPILSHSRAATCASDALPDKPSEGLHGRDREDGPTAVERTGVERVRVVDPNQCRVEACDADAQTEADVALHPVERPIHGLARIREEGDTGPEELQQLAAEGDSVLHVDEDAAAALECEVGIGAQAVLAVSEELHVA